MVWQLQAELRHFIAFLATMCRETYTLGAEFKLPLEPAEVEKRGPDLTDDRSSLMQP